MPTCNQGLRVVLALIVLLTALSGASAASALHYLPYPSAAAASPAQLSPPVRAEDKISARVWTALSTTEAAELIVVLKEQVDPHSLAVLGTPAARGQSIQAALLDLARRSQAPLLQWMEHEGIPHRSFYSVNALWVKANRGQVMSLAARSEVAQILTNPRIQGDQPVTAAALSATTSITWSLPLIGATEVWAMGFTGQDVVVAGQDTGYDWDHPALKAQYRGWDGAVANHDYAWHDAIHTDLTGNQSNHCGFDNPEPCDDNGHGTHTMGIMAGDSGGNPIGVAPGARWIGCRNMEEGWGTPASYIECFDFFLAPYPVGGEPADGQPELAPDVINNSWSCTLAEGCDTAHTALLQASVEAVEAAGILVVGSAGNRGSACSTVTEPIAIFEATFSIGATDSLDSIASFSSRGPVTIDGSGRMKPNLSAPGVDIYSSLPGTGYGTLSGTSMASPHVAGAAALVWSAHPDLRGQVSDTKMLLSTTAVPYTSTQCGDLPDAIPNNVYGWGRVDARSAVESAATLNGTISDTHGAPVGGAQIRAALAIATWDTVSAPDGSYVLRPIAGSYTVTAAAPGYGAVVLSGISVAAGVTTTLDITMEERLSVYLPLVMRIEGQSE